MCTTGLVKTEVKTEVKIPARTHNIYTKYLRRREGVLFVVVVFLTYLFGLGPSKNVKGTTSASLIVFLTYLFGLGPSKNVKGTTSASLLVFLITFSLARICSFMESFKHELIQTSKKEVSDYFNHLRIS